MRIEHRHNRFYERSGCFFWAAGARRCPAVYGRNVEWLILLASLRETGMPMKDMRHFAGLYKQGNKTIPERKSALQNHALQLEKRREALDRCALLLARKLKRYDQIMAKPYWNRDMKIIVVGAQGDIGKAACAELGGRHDLIRVGRTRGDLRPIWRRTVRAGHVQ